ncbi:VWA domain-containing protein [Ancylobacter radicis]|uniref:VWA domain-containing protein n=1 Tax=Ancylobacter radicis TaxID=2836179 RepID=A0ABS5R3X4_9HYPH|nr:VWA domain-containing protein [Ancylobacter radicis]MBS9476363.1 VWA domain-containing protein [Ancylobacter radicis]
MTLLARLLRDWRLTLTAGALLATLAALAAPQIVQQREARDLLLVVDVTGSMNVRDMDGRSRLAAAKEAAQALLAALPCQSRLGLGIFTERRTFLLFEPAEVCENFAAIDGAIDGLDWRMAWEGDSYVARGVHSALAIASSLDADLVFMTDGHEAPPLAAGTMPPFDGEPGRTEGVLVGIGGTEPVPIPKYNEDGRETGFYAESDVPQENRMGPPPEDAPTRAGWNPRNAPWGDEVAGGTEHLSSMKAEHLQSLASQTGLAFVPLEGPIALSTAVTQNTRPRLVEVAVDTAPLPAAAALGLLSILFAAAALTSRRPERLPA